MGEWILPCDCCGTKIKKIQNANYGYDSYNLNDTPHQKHYKIWVSSVASFSHYEKLFERIDPTQKIGDMTYAEFDKYLDSKLNLKFGQYYHGQRQEFKEVWLKPKYLPYQGIDYYVSGNVDALIDEKIYEFKTTWVSSKTKMKGILERARTQANLYSWVSGINDIIIEIQNLLKPELSFKEQYIANSDESPQLLYTYIDENKKLIKQY